MSGTGTRERRYFKSKKEADAFARQQRIRLENYGTASTLLPAGKVDEAVVAFEKLKGTGAGLVQAVDHFLEWRERRNASLPFKAMFERFMEAKSGRSVPYKKSLRQTLPRFAELHERVAVDITLSDIEPLLLGMSVSVQNAFLRNLRAVFNYGIRRGWCRENPILLIEMESLKPRRLILTNEQVSALLIATARDDLELLPYQLFCIFAGIRPEEVKRLSWDNVNLEEKFIEIPDEMSKTDVRRVVDMEPVLVRWLSFYIRAGGTVEKRSLIVPQFNLRKRLRKVRLGAGIDPWPQDAPRRTYASCWLAAYDDVNKLNNLMGHKSPEMLWRHYHRAVTMKRAIPFWKIDPPKISKKWSQ